jgi:hypothetical protein
MVETVTLRANQQTRRHRAARISKSRITSPPSASRPLSQRQVLHPVRELLRLTCQRDELQMLDTETDWDLVLMGVNNAGEGLPIPLSLGGLGKEVLILREEDTSQLSRPIEQLGIIDLVGVIFLGG